jgi:hypothetical protein
VVVLFFIIGCFGEDIEDPQPPATPRWVEKSSPEDTLECGIDAYPEGDGIFLEWYRNLDEDLEGYRIYRAEGSPDIGFSMLVDIGEFDLDTLFFDDSVRFDIDYFYYLIAYDQAGNKSEHSDTIRYQVIEKVGLLKPSGEISERQPDFVWNDSSEGTDKSKYVIRVENYPSGEIIWISNFSPDYGSFEQKAKYNADGKARYGSLVSGESYRWRIDAIKWLDNSNRDIAGSESNWGYFTVKQ